ncbi:hypothetical protein [Achromobacter sp. UBA2119]|uniref:hypothetical protein n=1 Tax=Achromobacter sp. UBA2119 TaxID=1945911 RepID=UPI00257F77F6|nr:hypothetical protein [Achromobacter sp. UBA2119]
MTTSYSEKILQALAQRGRLNTRQLAAQISCDTKKATQLVSFMRTSKKLKTDGEIDGLAAYSLTDFGHSLVQAEAPSAARTPAQPTSMNDLADAHMRPPRHDAALPQPKPLPAPRARAQQDAQRLSEIPAPAFGLLNTGEFLIMVDGHTIKIPAEYVPAMRAQLNPNAGGVFQ